MKRYNVTVNGKTYEVVVEEIDSSSTHTPPAAPVSSAAPAATIPAPAPSVAPAPVPAERTSQNSAGTKKVEAPLQGTIVKIAVKVGDTIKEGDLVCILEALKMENEVFSAVDGTVASINAPQGSSVDFGDTILTLN